MNKIILTNYDHVLEYIKLSKKIKQKIEIKIKGNDFVGIHWEIHLLKHKYFGPLIDKNRSARYFKRKETAKKQMKESRIKIKLLKEKRLHESQNYQN